MVLEKIYLIGQSQTRTVYGGHINWIIGTKYENFLQKFPYSNNSLCLLVLVEKIF
jgi:membrane protein YqaA with SNARE-associated domain